MSQRVMGLCHGCTGGEVWTLTSTGVDDVERKLLR